MAGKRKWKVFLFNILHTANKVIRQKELCAINNVINNGDGESEKNGHLLAKKLENWKMSGNKRTNSRNAELSYAKANAISKWIDGPRWICLSCAMLTLNATEHIYIVQYTVWSLRGIRIGSKFKIYVQIVVKSICSVYSNVYAHFAPIFLWRQCVSCT